MTPPVLGHCRIYPPTSNGPIPYLYGLRSVRERNSAGTGIHSIACSNEEYVWVVRQLARRRAKSTTRGRRAGKGVQNH
jgi:hypothetical protein